VPFRGSFTSALRWHHLDALWDLLRADANGGWYLYAVGEPPPAAPASGEQVERFIEEIDALLRREHAEDYCGIVYADDRAAPRFVKIYDPNNLGVVCGFSDSPPLPGWIMSKLGPWTCPRRSRRRRGGGVGGGGCSADVPQASLTAAGGLPIVRRGTTPGGDNQP
jgi:hypothetical protein